MGRKSGVPSRFRLFIARISGRIDRYGSIKPREKGDNFKTLLGLMIAVVTITGAVVAWRSALASTKAGNSEDSGLLASLNLQEASTVGGIEASQHRAAHLEYFRYIQLALMELDEVNAEIEQHPEFTEAQKAEMRRDAIENGDVAITAKGFIEPRYLDTNNIYDAEREQAENLAEAAQRKNLEPNPQFSEADQYRAISVALVATLVLLAISLWLFALAETLSHSSKYALALGGVVFLALGGGSAWAIESGASLNDVYNTASFISIITGVIVAVAISILIVVTLVRGRENQPAYARHGYPPAPGTTTANSYGAARQGAQQGAAEDEGRFKEVVTMLIASVTLFAALVGWLQADSGARGDQAIRDAQRFASEALGKAATGKALVNFQSGTAYRVWNELLVRAYSADGVNDTKAAERYRTVMTETLNLSAALADPASYLFGDEDSEPEETPVPSPQLMAPPYFDPASQAAPQLLRYEADVYVTKQTELSERSNLSGDLNNVWENKANAYIVHLTLLAAALALFGLSLSFSGLARPVFVTVGVAITLVTAGSVASVFGQPVRYIPDSAVEAYAKGVGLNYSGDAHAAVAAFDDALNQSPGYANALAGRGEAHLALGGDEGYIAATKDYEAAQAAGKDDALVAWNLGWIYYLQGRFDDSIRMSRHSLDIDPTQSGVQLNLAIAKMASGRTEEAKAEYRDAMSKVTQRVAAAKASGKKIPPSLWFYLDAGGRDLEGLYSRLIDLERPWMEAPAKATIVNPEAVQQASTEIFQELKSLITALENTGRPPEGQPTATFQALKFSAKHPYSQEEFADSPSFEPYVKEVTAKFDYAGVSNGQTVQWKVFHDGYELPEFRIKYVWDKGESGEAEETFGEEYSISQAYSFLPGDYIIEMYVDNVLSQFDAFDIKSSSP
jgi:tetratricopeptide (TPR) repeat protein